MKMTNARINSVIIGCYVAMFINISHAESVDVKGYTINSDKQSLLPDGNVKASGNVHVVNGDMVIDANEAIYHRNDPKNPYITASGGPIKYKGKTEDGKVFDGTSIKMKYTINSGELVLSGNAFIRQYDNTLSAQTITYNINTKKMTAFGDAKNRVKTVIYPEQLKNRKK